MKQPPGGRERTAAHLWWAVKGMLPVATVTLLLGAVLRQGAPRAGATLSFMGLALGSCAGVVLGGLLRRRPSGPADQHLAVLLGMLCLPLAVLPAQGWGRELFSFRGWGQVFLGVLLALPLGAATGCFWRLRDPESEPKARRPWLWVLAGAVIGILLSLGAVLLLKVLRGAFLVNLFLAPLLWPALPYSGPRSLPARMLFTLVVLVSVAGLLLTG